jgi:lipid A 3-O-deacylase
MLTATLVLAIGLLLPPPLALPPGPAAAVRDDDAPDVRPRSPATTVSMRWENDVVAGTDSDYSNGTSISLSHEGRGLLGGMWDWFGLHGGRRVSSYEIGQLIVTPKDISATVPDPTDRPYAGLLYVALSTQYARENRFHGLKFITGVVGPASGAAETQSWFHRLIGKPQAQGWGHQLQNEPILNVVYEHRRRYSIAKSESGWGTDAIPVVGGMLGNVLIQAQAGAQVRVGFTLPDDYGTTLMRGLGNLPFPRVRAGRRAFGVYAFAGGGGNAVARNLALDGNTFRDGPRVDTIPFFAAAEAGVSLWTRWFEATLTYVAWGREYESQPKASQFGAATVAFRF